MHRPLKRTLCSSRKFSSCSLDEKFISRETARHFSIFFGTRAVQRTTQRRQNFILQLW